ncbi:MAG: multidrug transporter, partial [Spirochaetaceae bacterium]
LAEMQAIARLRVWEKLNKTISIADKDDFFIDDDVVEHILQMDREEASLDIVVGEGAYLGHGVRLSEGVSIDKNARLTGNIILGKGVHIGESAQLSAFPGQTMRVGDNTRILAGNIIKGDVIIGRDCLVETPVRITGSTKYPVRLGASVRIKGSSYLFGCIVEDDCHIINCILRTIRVRCRRDKSGNVIPVCYIFPEPEGRESLEQLK